MTMSEENLSEYTVNDFSAVDDQISEIAKRERARTFAYRLESARYLVGYTALAIFLVGLLSIVLAWAYRLVTEPHQTETVKVVKPEIIEKEVIRVVKIPVYLSDPKLPTDQDTSYKGPNVQVKDATGSANSVVTNYTVFQSRSSDEFTSYGVNMITTGWNYESSDEIYPTQQYCYISKLQKNSDVTTRIDIGKIDGNEKYESLLSQNLAKDASIPFRVLKKIEVLCTWASL